MNNESPINKAQRLTEAEVHAAAEELQDAGSKISSIELYRHLGRGSLTTITNFLKSWRPGDEDINTMPALINLPDSLKAASEQLIIKLWSESQKLAESELQSQREALRQAEAMANEKIEEAQAFSEEQAKQIESLKVQIEILKKEAGESDNNFSFEIKNLRNDLENARINVTIFEQRFIETEKQLNKAINEIKELRGVIKSLEADKQKEVDTSRKEERRLENELTKLRINETILNQKIDKTEENYKKLEALKEDQAKRLLEENREKGKQRDEAIKEAAKLSGELEAWKTLQPKKTEVKENQKKSTKPPFKQTDIKEIIE